MDSAAISSAYIPLTSENERRAMNAIDSTPYARDAVNAAQQSIGQAFSVATADAESIFTELIKRKLIEIRNDPDASIDHKDPNFKKYSTAKYVRAKNIDG
jgi:hypothetical protein